MTFRTCFQIGIACLLSLIASPASADILPGDIVIIRVHSGDPDVPNSDGFTWLALRDITADEVPWTDASWGATNVGGVRQGWVKEDSGSAFEDARKILGPIAAGTIGEMSIPSGFGTTDQIFLYTGLGPGTNTSSISEEEAGILFGVNFGSDAGWVTSGSASNMDSYEPEGVGHLGMTLALGVGLHWYYNGPISGTAETLLSEIRNPNNWTLGDSKATSWNELRSGNFMIQIPEPATTGLMLGSAMALMAGARLRRANARDKLA